MLLKKTAIDLPDTALEALGNAERRRLIRSLSDGPKSVGELARNLPISRPAVSRHLRLLEDAGLVAHSPLGTRNVYRLDSEGLRATAKWLTGFRDEAEARLKLLPENTQSRGNGRG